MSDHLLIRTTDFDGYAPLFGDWLVWCSCGAWGTRQWLTREREVTAAWKKHVRSSDD